MHWALSINYIKNPMSIVEFSEVKALGISGTVKASPLTCPSDASGWAVKQKVVGSLRPFST